ncbi:MAG: alpha/beta fold hydrolase [Planctomycetaceae bacterium]
MTCSRRRSLTLLLIVGTILSGNPVPADDLQNISTLKDWKNQRASIMTRLESVMGPLPDRQSRVPLSVRQVQELRTDGVLRTRLSFQSDASSRVPAWLLRPVRDAGRHTRRPAVLCLHQTVPAGKDEPAGLAGSPNMHYALELARRGYVTLSPDYPSFGEHTWDFQAHPEYVSGTMKAIHDNCRAVDFLQSLSAVDPDRIGVIGHSLGGHNAMFTAAFEPRLKVIVSSCGFTSFQRDDVPSWTGPRYMPRIASEFGNTADRLPFDFADIIATFSPRPFLACAAIHDRDFNVTGVRESMAAAQPIYSLHGRPDHLQAIYPDSPHDFPPAARRQAFDFLDRHLKP